VEKALKEFADRFFAENLDCTTRASELLIRHISNKRLGMVVDIGSALDVCRTPRGDGESNETYLARQVILPYTLTLTFTPSLTPSLPHSLTHSLTLTHAAGARQATDNCSRCTTCMRTTN
jgi:hypothetical protein